MAGPGKWPFSLKLTVGITLLVSGAVACLTLLTMHREQQAFYADAELQARLVLQSLSSAAVEPLSSGEKDRVTSLIRSLPAALSMSLCVYDAQGQVIASSGDEGLGAGLQAADLGRRLVESGAGILEWQSEQLVAGEAVVVDGQSLGAVGVALSRAPLKATIIAIRNLGLAVAGAVVVIGTLLALVISRSLTNPLRQMVQAVERIARGDFRRTVVPVEGELAALAQALDDLTLKLQETSGREGAIFQAVLEGIICIDQTGKVIASNPAAERMFGYQRREMLERWISDLILPASLKDRARQDLSAYLDKGEGSLFGQRIEAMGLHSDGSQFPIEWGITRLSPDAPLTFAVIVHDIGDRKRAEMELRQAKEHAEAAYEAKSTFIAHVSHELRAPLTSILGFAEYLQQDALRRGYADLYPDLEKIRMAGEHLRHIVSDILDLSKIEAGKVELCLETFDVVPLVDDVVAISRPLVERNGNVLQIDCSGGVGQVYADRTKVQQILLNLISNAAKYTHNGTITLLVARRPADGSEWICFGIRDTGIGMTPEQIENLFQPFTKVSSSAAGDSEGSGLGLAICRGLCQVMGGDISAESTVGRGSTFTVRLPVSVPLAQEGQQQR